MSHTRLDAFDHALHTAHAWVADVAKEFGTEDRRFAYRVLRAWLHTLRDRLPVDNAAQFAAQLPEILRGIFYDGWVPARVPMKYGPDEFVGRFAEEARIPVTEVRQAVAAVTRVVSTHLSAGQLPEALATLPPALRSLLLGPPSAESAKGQPATPAAGAGAMSETPEATSRASDEDLLARLDRVEAQVASLAEAIRILAHGMEDVPGQEPDEHRAARAARLAHEILLARQR